MAGVSAAWCLAGGGRPADAAEAERVPLTWDTPPGCPAVEAVLADVKRNLAESGDERAPFVAAVNVQAPAGRAWHASLRVETRGGRAERQFEAESCEAIASAAALVIALSAESGRESAPVSVPEEPPADAAPRAPGSKRRLSLMVNGVLDRDTMPNPPAPGIEAAVGPEWTGPSRRVRLYAGAGYFPKQRASSWTTPADVWLVTVSGHACMSLLSDPFELGLCAGAELAIMTVGNASNDQPMSDATQAWVAPLGSGLASWRLSSRFTAFLRADVAAPLVRQSFWTVGMSPGSTVQFYQELYKVPATTVRGALGIETRFF